MLPFDIPSTAEVTDYGPSLKPERYQDYHTSVHASGENRLKTETYASMLQQLLDPQELLWPLGVACTVQNATANLPSLKSMDLLLENLQQVPKGLHVPLQWVLRTRGQ